MKSSSAAVSGGQRRSKERIPVPVLVRLYRFARAMSQEDRLELARWLIAKPELVDGWFKRSVGDYERGFSNEDEIFRPQNTKLPKATSVGEIKSGRDLAAIIADGERWWDVAGAPDLRFRFVDYEVPPLRKTGGVRFADGLTARSAMLADLLLVSASGAPVVGEVKAATETYQDSDPVMALIQGLTLCSQLATLTQMNRLANSYPDAQFDPARLLDLYVIVVKPKAKAPARFQDDLYTAAKELARVVNEQPHVRIEQIAVIEARWDGQLELRLAEAAAA